MAVKHMDHSYAALGPPPPSRLPKYATFATIFAFLVLACQYLEGIKVCMHSTNSDCESPVSTYLLVTQERWYIFDPTMLHELSQEAIATHEGNMPLIVSHILRNLTETYGTNHINPREDEWVFNNAGGAMGAMYIIHASITEYLIIFGTPLGTEGHTGRHTADDYFYVLHGEEWAFSPPNLTKEVCTRE